MKKKRARRRRKRTIVDLWPPRPDPDPLIQHCIELTLKNPRLRKKVEYYSGKILKAICEKMARPPRGER